jgi:hypothetical protein
MEEATPYRALLNVRTPLVGNYDGGGHSLSGVAGCEDPLVGNYDGGGHSLSGVAGYETPSLGIMLRPHPPQWVLTSGNTLLVRYPLYIIQQWVL